MILILICDFDQHWDCEGDEGSLHCHKEHLQKYAHQVIKMKIVMILVMVMIMTMMDDHDHESDGDLKCILKHNCMSCGSQTAIKTISTCIAIKKFPTCCPSKPSNVCILTMVLIDMQ